MHENVIDALRSALNDACYDPRIRRIVLFGSYAKGTACAASDIDLFLDSKGQISGLEFFALKYRLEEALQAEIDLLPDQDVIPGSDVDQEIKRYGVVVYAA